jgi:hypothetical protein
MRLSGIESATLWLVSYSLNHLRHCVPLTATYMQLHTLKPLIEMDIHSTYLKYKHKMLLQKTVITLLEGVVGVIQITHKREAEQKMV